jgi:competence protein ComEA
MAWRVAVARFFLALFLIFCLSPASGFAKKKPPEKPVNINAANSDQLQQVPGIGPATAQKILQMRKSYGPFKSVDDLLAIRGLAEKRLNKMRKCLTIGRPAAPKPASKVTPSSEPPREKLQDDPQKNRKRDSSPRFARSDVRLDRVGHHST